MTPENKPSRFSMVCIMVAMFINVVCLSSGSSRHPLGLAMWILICGCIVIAILAFIRLLIGENDDS